MTNPLYIHTAINDIGRMPYKDLINAWSAQRNVGVSAREDFPRDGYMVYVFRRYSDEKLEVSRFIANSMLVGISGLPVLLIEHLQEMADLIDEQAMMNDVENHIDPIANNGVRQSANDKMNALLRQMLADAKIAHPPPPKFYGV